MDLVSIMYLVGLFLSAFIYTCLGALAVHALGRTLTAGWFRLSNAARALCALVALFLCTLGGVHALHLVQDYQRVQREASEAEDAAIRELFMRRLAPEADISGGAPI